MGMFEGVMSFRLPVTAEILNGVAKLDAFRAVWSAAPRIPADRLDRWRAAATVQSVGASSRLAGVRVADGDVAAVLEGRGELIPEALEIRGLARALDEPVFPPGSVVTLEDLQRLNARITGVGDPRSHPSPFREAPLHHEAFDDDGHAIGLVFQTLPPRLVRDKTESLLSWLEIELHGRDNHPLLVIAAFALALMSASPFERGNGRTARAATAHILRRTGYTYLPFASFDRVVEEMRAGYYQALDASQTHLWSGEANLEPWVSFFLEAMRRHRERLEAKMEIEERALDLPPLQRAILDTVREHGTAAAGLLLHATGVSRNTLKDNLRRLVERQLLERVGQKRGAYYRLAGSAERIER